MSDDDPVGDAVKAVLIVVGCLLGVVAIGAVGVGFALGRWWFG